MYIYIYIYSHEASIHEVSSGEGPGEAEHTCNIWRSHSYIAIWCYKCQMLYVLYMTCKHYRCQMLYRYNGSYLHTLPYGVIHTYMTVTCYECCTLPYRHSLLDGGLVEPYQVAACSALYYVLTCYVYIYIYIYVYVYMYTHISIVYWLYIIIDSLYVHTY